MESTGEVAAPTTTGNPKVDSLLSNMDRRAKDIKTLTSDITITSQEAIPGGRKSVRTGRLYLRKPNDLFLDLTENGYARKVWVTGDSITDYSPDLKSAIKVDMAPGSDGKATVIGLSTTSDELRRQFDMTAEAPSTQHPDRVYPDAHAQRGAQVRFHFRRGHARRELALPAPHRPDKRRHRHHEDLRHLQRRRKPPPARGHIRAEPGERRLRRDLQGGQLEGDISGPPFDGLVIPLALRERGMG